MDADEFTLEDLDCKMMLQPAAVPTDPPICLTRERHELQPVYAHTRMRQPVYVGLCDGYIPNGLVISLAAVPRMCQELPGGFSWGFSIYT